MRKFLQVCSLLTALAAVAGGCGGSEEPAQAVAPEPIRVGREGVVTVETGEIQTGPVISGQLAAEREATVRAQVGGSIVGLTVEQGQNVRRGQVLARIEARDLQEAVDSARVAVRSAENALQLARAEFQRTETLVAGGALAERDLDNARNAVSTAESQLAAARAKLTSSQQQLADTTIRAPIAGVVSARPVNMGDVVQPGAALVTIIDPASMRLEASVPSDRIGEVRIGAPVAFTVRGYPGQTFAGRVERISPAADPATRQVPIFVTIPNAAGRLIAGLYAEGRISTESRRGLVVPSGAVDTSGSEPSVTRLRDGKAERVTVQLGLRDPETERVEVRRGVVEGDLLLAGPSRGIPPGTPVQVTGR